MLSIADKLAAINHPVSDSELVTRTLNGLQHEQNSLPFVYAIENRERPPSFADLRARLLVHEQRVNGLQLNQSSTVAPTGSQTAEIAYTSKGTTTKRSSLRVSVVNGLVEPYPENTTQRTKQIPGDHNASRTSTRAFSLMNRECSGIARRLREGPGSTSKSKRCELA